MSRTLVLLWLGTSAARGEAEADLDSWARSRLVRLEDAQGELAADSHGYSPATVARIEDLLEAARVAADSLDEASALDRLGEAERLLLAHPELPQAAWLLAEKLVSEASLREKRPDELELSRALRARAIALEGGRAPAFGSETAPADATGVSVNVEGIEAQDELYWNGRLLRAPFRAAPGLHHARVLRRGRPIWIGWVTVPKQDTSVRLAAPEPSPCSLDDLGPTRLRAGELVPTRGTRCAHWAVARAAPGGIEIATCEFASCGPLLPWRRTFGGEYAGPPQPAPEGGWPRWASFVVAGVGAAAITGVVLWHAGAFDARDRERDRVIFDGPAGRR